MNRYLSFCLSFNVSNPFPLSETMLCYFAVALAREGLAPSTIKTYLAAIHHAHIERGFEDLRDESSLPRLQMVQSGVHREKADCGLPVGRRLPITPPVLRLIRRALLQPPVHFDSAMIWAASATCFFVFFRAGEITIPPSTSFNPVAHLAWGDVSMDGNSPPRKVRVRLKRSKTDQYGRGVEVWLGATSDELCPVQAIVDYARRRGRDPGPFFRLEDGSPLTKGRFVERVRAAMRRAGIDTSGYSGHSFRIGAATAAAQAGLEDSVIQAMGRWSSPAFLRYIRTPREQLAHHTQALAAAGPSQAQ